MTTSQSDMTGFAATWDEQVRSLWHQDYPNELAELLQHNDTSSVLDCAGGTGYPAIELKQLGWDVTYSDGSLEMLDFFSGKTAMKKLKIPHYLSLWGELSEKVPNTFDAVLCRGNSFLGVSTYSGDEMLSRDEVIQVMKESLEGMFSKVNSGGLLYIDIPTPEESKPPVPYHNDSPDGLILTTVSYDPITQIRKTQDINQNPENGEEIVTTHLVYPLDQEELIDMLLSAGFQRVEKSPIKEAFYIDAYLAFKG